MTRTYVDVTKDIFFATVGQLNVHPRVEKDASYWEMPQREVLGISTPGYLCQDAEGRHTTEKTWRICQTLLPKEASLPRQHLCLREPQNRPRDADRWT